MDEGNLVTTVGGGDGLYSYSKNSQFQRKAIDAVKDLISKAIDEKLDTTILSSSSVVRVADLGCAAGPNTFLAVRNIIDAIELKCRRLTSCPEFQVFFNDQASNDFNQLFSSLPPERRYFVAASPGSFHGRLFPISSVHFVHSSYSVQCLSRVPAVVSDKTSPAWNKGQIHYSDSTDRVLKAFQDQFAADIDCFLKARAQEIVPGGLLALIVAGRPNGTSHSDPFVKKTCELLGSCLVDLANEGKISNEKVDSFNLPAYIPSLEEVEALVKRNDSFDVEMMESVPQERPKLDMLSHSIRAGMGGFIKEHFGEDIVDELFDLLRKKFEENAASLYEFGNSINLFVLLKRSTTI